MADRKNLRSNLGHGVGSAVSNTDQTLYHDLGDGTFDEAVGAHLYYWTGSAWAKFTGTLGGGAVTIVDGGDVTQGAVGDAAWSGSGNGTVVAILKAIYARLRGGQATMANSLPVVLASDQSSIPVAATLAAGTNLFGQVAASDETTTIYSGTTALTPKFASIGLSATGTVVAAVGGKKIRVLSYVLVSNGTVNVKWQSHVIPTDKSGLLYLVANTGASVGYSPVGHFETISGEALDLNLSASVAVGGHLTYIEV